jgi:two-component system, sensor histidine kinase and response regulator
MDVIKVLVVDDEMGIRMSITRILQRLTITVPEHEAEVSFEVEQAETGEQALEMIKAAPPEILLLDNKLPGISGIEVLERMAQMNLDIHTVIITAYASIENAVRATKRGAYDMLPKPFTPAELKSTIEKVTNHLLMARRARELMAEKRKVRFQFISVLAHELKAPINAIESYLRIVKERSLGDAPEAYDKFIDRCMTRTEYMRKMIADLLDLTRIESGERARTIGPCDLYETAQMAMDTVKPEAASRGIAISMETGKSLVMQADRTELDIIFHNLLSNAVKYNRDNGRVDVSIEQEDDTFTIRVTDTGIGMTEQDCTRLFNDFVRIKNEKTTKILGSGLGLSTVKKIALLYGGDVSVTSEVDQGSAFTVVLKNNA